MRAIIPPITRILSTVHLWDNSPNFSRFSKFFSPDGLAGSEKKKLFYPSDLILRLILADKLGNWTDPCRSFHAQFSRNKLSETILIDKVDLDLDYS